MNYKPTILYVEDEKTIRKQLSKFLHYCSDKLYIAEDGLDGLNLYKECHPDIVVSDIKMPNMTGIDMVKAIKKINPKQHIIFTTAHSESGYFMNAIELQVDGYILKPIELNLLEDKIDAVVEQIQLKRELKKQYLILNEISMLQENLLMVLDENSKPIFANEGFLEYFQIADIKEFVKLHRCLCYLFIEHEDFFYSQVKDEIHWIDEIENLKSDERVVSIINMATSEPESFLISIAKVQKSGHSIISLTEITNLSIENKRFKKKAYTDQLTKIPNRAYFEEEFEKEIARHYRYKTPLSFIILDIDKFKSFNDTYGHQKGDDILKELSSMINQNTRQTDTFARWGGEEFVKVLPNATLENAKTVAESLRKMIESHTFSDGLKLTCSFGVAEFGESDTKESVIRRADKALYRAKENGRNMVEG